MFLFTFPRVIKSYIKRRHNPLFRAVTYTNDGLTVVELMIAVAILVLVLAGGYSFFSFGWNTFDRGTERAIAQNNLRMAAEAITKEVRFAEGISIIDTVDIPDPVEADNTYLFTNNEGQIEKKTENSSIIIPHEIDSSIILELEFEKSSSNVLKVIITETISNTNLETEIRVLNIPASSSIENNNGNALQVTINDGSGDNNGNVLATGITLNQGTMDLAIGTTGVLSTVFEPENTTNQGVIWDSNEPGITTVNNGVVTGVAEGTAIITVTAIEGNFTDSCIVTVFSNSVNVTGVSLDQSTMTLTVGEATGLLVATVSPSNATDKSLTWTSNSDQVATVSSGGVVTPVSSGNAVIIVTTVDGGYSDSCDVEVFEPEGPVYWQPDLEYPEWENTNYGGVGFKVTYNGNRYISRQWIAAGTGNPEINGLWILQPLPNEDYPRWRSIEPYPSDGQTRVIHDDKVYRAKWHVNAGVEPPNSPWELET